MAQRVLIVEDEQHLAEGLRFNLEAEGFEAEIQDDGDRALARLLDPAEHFDLVVLDVSTVPRVVRLLRRPVPEGTPEPVRRDGVLPSTGAAASGTPCSRAAWPRVRPGNT